MAPCYKIAVIQLHPKPLDPSHNFSKAADFIRDAASKGAHLAVLPEYHLTNWVPEDPQFLPLCKQWKDYLHKYQELAKELGICIVPGTIVEAHVEAETGEDQLHNVAYFIDDKGKILGRYQKKNLWYSCTLIQNPPIFSSCRLNLWIDSYRLLRRHPERPHLTSSTQAPHETIQTPLGPVGMLICWDLAFPEAFRELIANGAKMIIIPTFWTHADCSNYGRAKNPMSEKLFLESTITARAFENTCAIVLVNAGAPPEKEHSTYAGLSSVAMPFVGGLGDETKDTNREGMSVVEVDMELVEEAEKNYRVRADIKGKGWHYTYRHQGGGMVK